MKHAAGLLAFVARFAVLGLALAFVVSLLWPGTGARLRQHFGLDAGSPPPAASPASTAPAAPTLSYADAVARAAPSVVNIYANKTVTEQALRMYTDPWMQQVFGGVPVGSVKRREQSLGSGVIVSADGYVLTNNHVIANADDIQVLLYDGRVAKATLVGADPETDLAVLKIDAGNLPVAHILPHTTLRPGDVVLAIGNPFGLNQTVTMGIVSAIGRQLSSSSPEDFIQTDAAINLGNSGGALVNSKGELVGINSSIASLSQGSSGQSGNIGIGFAIPVQEAKSIAEQLIKSGKAEHAFLGVTLRDTTVTDGSAKRAGAQVASVQSGTPAANAGLKNGDVVVAADGQRIDSATALVAQIREMTAGDKTTLTVIRDGQRQDVQVTLAVKPGSTS